MKEILLCSLVLLLVETAGCVAQRQCPKPAQVQTYPAPQADTYQYVDPDALLGPPVFSTPRLQGPSFAMPPAEAPGLTVTPFIGPDGRVVFCNEAGGVRVCQ